jgi:hypothetical protein
MLAGWSGERGCMMSPLPTHHEGRDGRDQINGRDVRHGAAVASH